MANSFCVPYVRGNVRNFTEFKLKLRGIPKKWQIHVDEKTEVKKFIAYRYLIKIVNNPSRKVMMKMFKYELNESFA